MSSIYQYAAITRRALREMITESYTHAGLETGGVLVGFIVKVPEYVGKPEHHKHYLQITRASAGGPNAMRRNNLFVRDNEFCQAFLDAQVKESKLKSDYVGEWHKHPSLNTHLSPLDVDSLRHVETNPDYSTDQPIFILMTMPNETRWQERQVFAYTCWGGEVSQIPLEVNE